jgi:hypothetical protein
MLTLVWAIAGMGSHVSGDMLRTSESCLADGALVIPGHRWLFFAAVAVAVSVAKFIEISSRLLSSPVGI